jgi:uncharacterized membrane protein YdcZ (DUF606 family)
MTRRDYTILITFVGGYCLATWIAFRLDKYYGIETLQSWIAYSICGVAFVAFVVHAAVSPSWKEFWDRTAWLFWYVGGMGVIMFIVWLIVR